MSKPKRPIFKYEIKQHNITNIHNGIISKTYFTVCVKDISVSWMNSYWMSLDIYGSTEMFREEYEYNFTSLVDAKKTLNDYVEDKRRRFENIIQNVSSVIEHGTL